MPDQPRTYSTEELKKQFGVSLGGLVSDTTRRAEPEQEVRRFSSEELEKLLLSGGKQQVSPSKAGTTPPSPAVSPTPTDQAPRDSEESEIGDAWQRGYGNLLKGMGSMFHLLDGWATDLSKATGLSRGGAFENVENWFRQKAEEEFEGATPATGKYARAPENLLGYLDPKRMYKVAAENVPLMGAFISSLWLHKGAGTALMFGVEGGSARETLDEYEARGGVVNPIAKQAVPVVVGAFNAALEKLGIGAVLKGAKVPGIKARIMQVAIGAMTEGTTEGAQEITQALGEASYKGALPENVGERFIESFYAGLVLGLGGTSISATFGEVGESPRTKLKGETLQEEEIDSTPLTGYDLLDMAPADAIRTIKDLPVDQLDIVKAEIERLDKQIDPFRRGLLTEEEQAYLTDFEKEAAKIPGFTREKTQAMGQILMGISRYSGRKLDEIITDFRYFDEKAPETIKFVLEKSRRSGPLDEDVWEIRGVNSARAFRGETPNSYKIGSLTVTRDLAEGTIDYTSDVCKILPSDLVERLKNMEYDDIDKGPEITWENAWSQILGSVGFDAKSNDTLMMTIFKEGNEYTFMHELGHVLHYFLKKEDLAAIEDWLGLTPEQKAYRESLIGIPTYEKFPAMTWTQEQREKFADGWAQYLASGKAPSSKLAELYRKLSEWVAATLNKLIETGAERVIEIGDGARAVFDKVMKSSVINKEAKISIEEWQRQKDILLAGLSTRFGHTVEYDLDKGFSEQDVLMERTQERIIELMSGMKYEDAVAWAESQLDGDAWLAYFKGEGPAPVELPHNAGTDIQRELLTDEAPPPNDSDGDVEAVEYNRPRHIGWLLQRIFTPEFLLKGRKRPLKDAASVIQGELYLNHKMRDYETWYKKLKNKMGKEERKQVRVAMEKMYQIQSENTPIPSKIRLEQELAELYAKYPRVKVAMDGVDKRGGVIALFEYVKKRYQNALRERARLRLTPTDNAIVDELIKERKRPIAERGDLKELARSLVTDRYDLDGMAREEVDRLKEPGAYSLYPQSRKTKKKKAITNREAKRLVKEAEDIASIDDWGLRDYITNIELGSYRVLDGDENTLAFGRTAREAKKKAYQIRQELKEQGKDVPKLRVEASFSPINPTEKRENVLAGEVDLFNVLPRYLYAMEKRIIMQPIVDRYKQNVKLHPGEYTGDVTNIIQTQIDYVLGARYSWGDMIADDVATHFGWETGKYSRNIARARKVIANLKLGYRPVAAFINALGGFGHTWVSVGNEFFVKGRESIRQGKYVTPGGEVIDMRAKLKEVEDEGQLAIDLAVNEAGEVSTRTPLWKPLGLFQLPEQFIRPHSFASNYIYQREVLGKNDFEATEAALQAIRFQNFAYNLSAIPHILRSPAGKLVGQFKTYLINELQFISTLRGRQIARMVGLQLVMAGPRGVIYLLKSIPILGALGLLDDAEEWLVREKGPMADIMTRGVGGIFGADISAPATFQLPKRPEDWGGPFLGDLVRFYKEVIIPSLQYASSKISDRPEPAYIQDDFVNWVSALSPLMYYLKDFDESVLVWDQVKKGELKKAWGNLLENINKPNVWIRDSAGNKAYKVGGLQDRLLLLMGAAPTNKSQYQVLRDIWRRDLEIKRENRRKWYNKVTKKLLKGQDIDEDLWHDAIIYRVDPSRIPTAYQFKQMTPQQRETLKANLFERAEAFDHFGVE